MSFTELLETYLATRENLKSELSKSPTPKNEVEILENELVRIADQLNDAVKVP